MPPMPSMGKIATARTMTPHTAKPLQKLANKNKMECGRSSMPVITVAPVVVQPDRDYKKKHLETNL
jgi:hypothetical protein